MPELEIGVVDGGFDQSFPQFNVQRKKITCRVLLNLYLNADY